MQIKRRLSETGASETQLRKLEARIDGTLPPDYRQFLFETNGGKPEPPCFELNSPGERLRSMVHYFLTLNEDESFHSIHEFLERHNGRIHPSMLPIACDPFGNLVLLEIRPQSAGAVYFWSQEKEDVGRPSWQNMSLLAHSFTEFVSMLE